MLGLEEHVFGEGSSCPALTAQMRPMLISETLFPNVNVSLTPALRSQRTF